MLQECLPFLLSSSYLPFWVISDPWSCLVKVNLWCCNLEFKNSEAVCFLWISYTHLNFYLCIFLGQSIRLYRKKNNTVLCVAHPYVAHKWCLFYLLKWIIFIAPCHSMWQFMYLFTRFFWGLSFFTISKRVFCLGYMSMCFSFFM